MSGQSSLRPILEQAGEPHGGRAAWRRSFAYEFYLGDLDDVIGYIPTLFAVRTEGWKLVLYPGYPSWTELYDLDADPGEVRNLAREPELAARVGELSAELRELEQRLGPRLEP